MKPEYGSNAKKQDDTFGVPNPLVEGLASVKPKLGVSHPLEVSERNVSGSFYSSSVFLFILYLFIRQYKMHYQCPLHCEYTS